MHADLVTTRRVLMVTWQRYLDADQAWNMALRDMNLWFPAASRPVPSRIGDPGSPIRRLYERRERALLQLEAMRLKLDAAKRRSAARKREMRGPHVLLITCSDA